MAIDDDDYPRYTKGLAPMLPLQTCTLIAQLYSRTPLCIDHPRATPCSSTQLGFTSKSLSPAFGFYNSNYIYL